MNSGDAKGSFIDYVAHDKGKSGKVSSVANWCAIPLVIRRVDVDHSSIS